MNADINLKDKSTSIEFYDSRYSQGYMEGYWSDTKKQRVLELIKELPLPETGDALDFGCGPGDFTEVIGQALPKWNVYGTDISQVAIENARKKVPNHRFFVASSEEIKDKKFDFIFSHHVLEHVYDIFETWEEMSNLSKESSSMLHILPCGNPGSFEYQLDSLVKKDPDFQRENCCFFEEPGHLRRLDTEKLTSIAAQYNFQLVKDYYANQYYGSLEWIVELGGKYILELINPPLPANDKLSRIKLMYLGTQLIVNYLVRYPALNLQFAKANSKTSLKSYLKFAVLSVFHPLSKLMNSRFERKVAEEWETRKTEKNGSEMYLFYRRKS